MEGVAVLTSECEPGKLVYWTTVVGEQFVGRLKEFDNGTAIVIMEDGTEKAVRCDWIRLLYE